MFALALFFAGLLSFAYATPYQLLTLNGNPDGSMCLDGSPYAYYYRPGTETDKWIIHHEGGGWCYTLEDCYERASTVLGSSTKFAPNISDIGGLLSDQAGNNPNFYTWNMVYLAYCDGASFSGYLEEPTVYQNTKIWYRGKNNLIAAANDLIAKGLNKASDVIITGCSAGGLATYLHLDWWAELLPSIKVRGIADAGYFLDTNSVNGNSIYTPEMSGGFEMWNSSGGVNQACIAAHVATNDTWKCMMAQYTYPHIKTPIFLYNSKYDSWQMGNILYLPCTNNISSCNSTEFQQFLQYGDTFLNDIQQVEQNPTSGLFVTACYIHCQSLSSYWTIPKVSTPDGTSITANQAFYNWYYGLKETTAVNTCNYPCNPTCP